MMNNQLPIVTPISKEELCKLTNDELCQRMDNVLYIALCETYVNPLVIESFPIQSIKEFYNTKIIQSLPDEHQRLALRKCFEYLTQHEYLSRVSGWTNEAIYGAHYDENNFWLSPRNHTLSCANTHIKIVSSAVALERFQDLLYIISTGKTLIDGKKNKNKSKFTFFKEWLLDPQNKFVFFAPNLILINKFKSAFRTAEVHEWSKLVNSILLLQKPTHEELNDPLGLINLLSSMWTPLLILLNDQIPLSTVSSSIDIDGDLRWLEAIRGNNITLIQGMLDKIKKQLK